MKKNMRSNIKSTSDFEGYTNTGAKILEYDILNLIFLSGSFSFYNNRKIVIFVYTKTLVCIEASL